MKQSLKLLILLFTVFALLSNSFRPASANWFLDSQGQLFQFLDGLILGKSDKASPSRGKSEEKSSRPSQNQTPGSQKPDSPSIQQITPQSNTLLLENRGNKIKPKFVDETGQDLTTATETPEDEAEGDEFEIEEPEDQDTIKIRSHENASLIIRNKIAAQTHFPLMVNLDTNELIVSTPKGQKIVTVLPDQAVQNMLAANVLDQLGGKGGIRWLEYQSSIATPSATPVGTPSATPTATPSASQEPSPSPTTLDEPPITLTTTQDNTLAYEIEGSKFEKLLGIFQVKLDRIVVVSAETGELLEVRQTLPTRLLDLVSI